MDTCHVPKALIHLHVHLFFKFVRLSAAFIRFVPSFFLFQHVNALVVLDLHNIEMSGLFDKTNLLNNVLWIVFLFFFFI